MRVSVKSLVVVAAVAMLALAIGLVARGTAQADPCSGDNCYEVPTGATLGGGSGADMTIECKWELPDMSPDTAAMHYEDAAGNHDDTPAQLADTPPCDPGVACVDDRHHMMGIVPNPDDDPIERQYEKWVAVHSASIDDIVDVYWIVWEPYVPNPPNGPNCADPVEFVAEGPQFCLKYQHHATSNLLEPGDGNPGLGSGGTMFAHSKSNCDTLANQTKMWEAAVETGQMTQAEVDLIIEECTQQEKAVFRVKETISKEQPYGEYRVEVTIVNSAGVTFRNVNYFDVLPFIHIRKDFTEVDWQTIQNGVTTVVSGDTVMETPGVAYADGTGVKPTIENVGNQEMYVSVHFDPLLLVDNPTKDIDRFDVKFRAAWQEDPNSIQVFDPVLASEWVCFDEHPLGSNDTGKIVFSVHPENAEAGDYEGEIDILGTGGSCPP